MSTIQAVNLKNASSASNNIVLDASGNATFAGTAAMASSFLRNRIINGDMRIDQRNAGASVTPSSGTFMLDRWAYGASQASKFTAQQNAGSVTTPVGFPNYLGMTVVSAHTVGASDSFSIYQPIEGHNFSDLGFGTANARAVTISFVVYSSLTGTFGGVLKNYASTRSYPFTYSIPSANTWTTISVTIPGDTSGTWVGASSAGAAFVQFGLGVGSTNSGPAGAWAGTNYNSATGAVSVVGTNGATFYLTGVQLEVGTVATPFERRQIGQELALCQRYYEGGGYNIWSGYCNGVSTYYVSTPYKVTKRASPTLTFSGISNSGFSNTAPIVGENQVNYFRADQVSNAASTAGFFQFAWASSAEL